MRNSIILLIAVLAVAAACTPSVPPVPTDLPVVDGIPAAVTPPCTPLPGSTVDPCEAVELLEGVHSHLSLGMEPQGVDSALHGPSEGQFAVHLVARATFLPGTIRCAEGSPFRPPPYDTDGWRTVLGRVAIECFSDVRVHDYILGAGADVLTIKVDHVNAGCDPGLSNDEAARFAERALAEGIWNPCLRLPVPIGGWGGREQVMFLSPSVDASLQVWERGAQWDIEQKDDGSVVAVHPDRDLWVLIGEFEKHRSKLEMSLPSFKAAVSTAHSARVAANGGRTGANPSYPMLVSDAGQLETFFRDIGAYDHADGPPAQPAPVSEPGPCSVNLGSLNEPVEIIGHWTDGDCRGTSGTNARFYTFQLERSGELRIASSSMEGTNLTLSRSAFFVTRRTIPVANDHTGSKEPQVAAPAGTGITYAIEVAASTPGRTGVFALTIQPPPIPPGNVVANIENRRMTVTWEPVEGASAHWVAVRPTHRADGIDWRSEEVTGTSHIVSGFQLGGVEYDVRMGAVNADGRVGWSAPVNVTAPALTPAPEGTVAQSGTGPFAVGDTVSVGLTNRPFTNRSNWRWFVCESDGTACRVLAGSSPTYQRVVEPEHAGKQLQVQVDYEKDGTAYSARHVVGLVSS